MTAKTSLTALGALSLVRSDAKLLPGRRKLLLLLTLLARREGRSVTRSELASLLWPESKEAKARQSLRQALLELREAVGEALVVNDRDVRLETGTIELDANRFEAEVESGAYGAAEARWQGDFLEGLELSAGEELRSWIEGERALLRRCRARVGEQLIREAEARGALADAVAHADRWKAALPEDSSAAEKLERLRGAAGRRTASTLGTVPLLTPDLVAREADFAILTGIWERVNRGLPGLAVIEGEAGTGRSRLLEEFLRWARRRDQKILILRARAFEAERGRSHLLARHLLAPLAGAPGTAAAPATALRALAGIAPEFAEQFPSLSTGRADDLPEAVARVLAEVAAEVRIVLAVDDVDLADRSSRELLEALLRRPVGGVLLVLTAIPGALGFHELERRTAPAGQLYRVRLGPFDQEELERALASMAEFAPDARSALAARLLAETGGNPLAAVELTTALADRNIIAPDRDGIWHATLPPADQPLPLPTTLTETLTARLHQLPADAARVLQTAAVLGRETDVDLLLRATGLSSQQLESALDPLVARRLIRISPDTESRLELTHEALRRSVYQGLSPFRRRELHRQALGALRARPVQDGETRAAIAYHRLRSRGRMSPVSSTVAVFALVGVIALGTVVLKRPQPNDPPPTLAVLPFVPAEPSTPGLDRAVQEAVTLALAQIGEVRVLDPPVTAPTATGAAAPPGAALILEGRVERTGTGIQLSATVRQPGRTGRVQSAGSVEGEPASLAGLAAQLAYRLFPSRAGALPFELSTARTSSIPALRNYLEGARLARQVKLEAAAQAYWRALQKDAGLAAAWHGLSRINAWFFLSDRARLMADSALAHSGGLLQHEQLALQGWQEFAYGNADAAEARFRQVLAIAPENVEATIGLAEVLFHHNWSRGRSPAESRPLWLAALAADSTDWRPHVHLWEVAAQQERWSEAAQALRTASVLSQDSTPVTQLLLAQLEGDTASLLDRIAELPADNEWALMQLATTEGTVLGRLDLARACLLRLAEPDHAGETQALAHEQLAYVALARGRVREAMEEIAQARLQEPVSAATIDAVLWIAPFLPSRLSDTGRVGALTRIRRAPGGTVKPTFLFWFDHDRRREPMLRSYAELLLERQTGGVPLRTLAMPGPGPMRDSLLQLRPRLEASLSAWQAAATGDTAAIVPALQAAWTGSEAVEEELSPFYSRPWDGYLKALALESSRPQAAANWYESLGQVSLAAVSYRAPARLRRARLLENLGQRREAIDNYRRGLSDWAGADPEFQFWIREARARLSALERSGP